MSGWWSSRPASSLIAFTSRVPAANDPVRKYAHAPSPTTRQSSTPLDSWNRRAVTQSLILSPKPSDESTAAWYITIHGAGVTCRLQVRLTEENFARLLVRGLYIRPPSPQENPPDLRSSPESSTRPACPQVRPALHGLS